MITRRSESPLMGGWSASGFDWQVGCTDLGKGSCYLPRRRRVIEGASGSYRKAAGGVFHYSRGLMKGTGRPIKHSGDHLSFASALYITDRQFLSSSSPHSHAKPLPYGTEIFLSAPLEIHQIQHRTKAVLGSLFYFTWFRHLYLYNNFCIIESV